MKLFKIILFLPIKLLSFILFTITIFPLFVEKDGLSFLTYLKVWFDIFLEKEDNLLSAEGGVNNE